MAARHSLDYIALPDRFLLFDVYHCTRQAFWSSVRRNELADAAGVALVPCIFQGHAMNCCIAASGEPYPQSIL
ncbi:RNA ligase family protein [Lautropia dentalis]|uniref:RNA ligase family protein n=1 Tax=Lautropia dentalis TaxID=2490857 RepID=UPI00193989A7